jgi:hypothetical protein
MQSSGELRREDASACLPRHCEPTGPREAWPDDRLREAIQSHAHHPGLVRFARNDEVGCFKIESEISARRPGEGEGSGIHVFPSCD